MSESSKARGDVAQGICPVCGRDRGNREPHRPSCKTTAPIGPKTVTVLGSHLPASRHWDGFDFARAEIRSHNFLASEDYHLGVPWAHPDDRKATDDDPDVFGIYRLRLKRGWRSFVQVDGQWMVSKAPRQEGAFGTPPGGQVWIVEVAL